MKLRLVWLAIACGAVAGCASPEATRTRAGGPGADTQNRPPVVKMHEGSQQFWETPVQIGVQHPSLEPARHAQQTPVQ
jgi:hypothetical protein